MRPGALLCGCSAASSRGQKLASAMWEGIVLGNAGQCGKLSLCALLRCGRVSRRWWEAVLAALPTLRALDFRGCEILACVAATCPSVTEVDVEGCRGDAQLRALAVRASALCDAASPRALFEFIAAEHGGARCPLEHLLALLSQG